MSLYGIRIYVCLPHATSLVTHKVLEREMAALKAQTGSVATETATY